MKKIFIFFTLFVFSCTSEVPHNMEEELAFRSDRWMKGAEWSWFWYSYQYKVYNGPAYSNHKNGERKEKGRDDQEPTPRIQESKEHYFSIRIETRTTS